MKYVIKEEKKIRKEQIVNLYKDAGWDIYVEDIDKLMRAYDNSLLVLSAWDDTELLGILRVIGDGETIIYFQDLLVLTSAKRNGIASELIQKAIDKYPQVRQKVLLTDDTPETVGFYNSVQFKDANKLNLKAFVRFEKL